jgi:hypothetical protein
MSNLLREAVYFSILSVATIAQGAEFEAHPSLAVSEEFTDNVFETSTNRISDYITRTLPGLALSYRAPVLTGDLNYVFDYRHYARKNRGDEITHTLSAKGHLTAVENFMYLDVSDEYQRVSLDVTRDVTKESLFFNQSDRNVATASPNLIFYPTKRIMVKTGYRFIDTRYFGSSGIDKTDHVATLDVAYELSERFSLTAGYTFIRETADIDNYSQHQALGGFRYEYADTSFVFAQAGNTWTHYDSGQRFNSIAWNAGITHTFDTVTGTVTTGVRYDEDPLKNIMKESFVSGTIEKRFKRSSFSLSSQYSEYVPTKYDPLQINTGSLKTKKYGATAGCQYEFTTDLNGRLGITAEKYEYEQPLFWSNTRRYQVDSGLSYLLAEQLTASLSYIFVDYYSPDIAADNKHVNRAMVEIKKTF